MKLLAIILASLASVGCTRVDTFKCTRSDECTLAGVAGVCEPAGLCSFPDPDCPSGKAFGELAGDQADRCVDVEGTTDPSTTTTTTTTDPSTTGTTGDPGLCLPAPDDDACTICTKGMCCDESMACEADVGCSCVVMCALEGGDPAACIGQCMINPQQNPALLGIKIGRAHV